MQFVQTTDVESPSTLHDSWNTAQSKPIGSAKAAREAVMCSLLGENSYLSELLNTVQEQVDEWQPRRHPDYTLVYDTMRQLHDIPHDILQPKEELVYRCLMERDADEAQEFADIRDQHDDIYRMSSRLLHQLSDISHGIKTARRDRLRPQLQRFIDAFRQHIELEENEIFPTAEKRLLAADWYALQSGISYLEAIHADDKLQVTNIEPQRSALEPASSRQSIAHYIKEQTERITASFTMAQLFSAYTLAESIGSISECAEELTGLGVKQAKAGVNATLDEIMACRDTSDGVVSLPGNLIRIVADNLGHTWNEAKHIVQESWQQQKQPLTSRVGLLQDIWHSNQP